MTIEQERIDTFESVLRGFGLDPVACRESNDWWRFEIEGVQFQGGIHSADARVLALICRIPASADIDAVYGDLGKAEAPGSASFIEADCYLYARAKASFAEVSAARLETMIRDCIAAAKSPAASSLRSRWQDW